MRIGKCKKCGGELVADLWWGQVVSTNCQKCNDFINRKDGYRKKLVIDKRGKKHLVV